MKFIFGALVLSAQPTLAQNHPAGDGAIQFRRQITWKNVMDTKVPSILGNVLARHGRELLDELEYFRHGCILQYLLRNMIGAA